MNDKRSQDDDYFVCPHCGAELAASAAFCRHCGASQEAGWGDEDGEFGEGDGYAPDEDFDYDDFIRREFPQHANLTSRQRAGRWFVRLVVVVLCLAFLCWLIAA